MPYWFLLLIPFAVAALTVTVNAAVNIKIKFAPDADAATHELKALALRALSWILNVAVVGILAKDVLSAEPLSRLAVFRITLEVGVLSLVMVFHFIHRVLDIIGSMLEVQLRHVEMTKGRRDVLHAGSKSDA